MLHRMANTAAVLAAVFTLEELQLLLLIQQIETSPGQRPAPTGCD